MMKAEKYEYYYNLINLYILILMWNLLAEICRHLKCP